MKAGRNDPCPCGSGKKYKKCCIAKEEASRETAVVLPPASSVAPRIAVPQPTAIAEEKPVDPIIERGDRCWEEFESLSGEDRTALFLKTLDDVEVMADELAFEMLNVLHTDAVASGKRARFAECVAALRERLPEVFDKSAQYYLHWCLLDALAEDHRERAASLARELAAHAGRDIDTVERAVDLLAYHGELSMLVDVLRIGWPFVESSDGILPWGISEFANQGANFEIFDYLEHTAAPDPADPVLLERVRFFVDEPREDYLREFIEDLTGTSGREWRTDDFALRPPRKQRRDDWDDEPEETQAPDPGALNLSRLLGEFVGYLRREEGVPFPRGEMVRRELYPYFSRRHAGELDPRPSMLEEAMHPSRKPPKPPRPVHPLCPERVTLDVHLGGLMGMMSGQYHTASAVFKAIPAWLRFLERQRLIDAATREKVTADLRPLHATFQRIWEQHTDDPLLSREVDPWLALP